MLTGDLIIRDICFGCFAGFPVDAVTYYIARSNLLDSQKKTNALPWVNEKKFDTNWDNRFENTGFISPPWYRNRKVAVLNDYHGKRRHISQITGGNW